MKAIEHKFTHLITVLSLLVIGACPINVDEIAPKSKPNRAFHAEVIGPFPEGLRSDTVRSAGVYLLLAHLVRPLLRLNRNSQIEGDLADRWKISDNFTVYRFHLDSDAKWSDGRPVTAHQVEEMFVERQKQGSTTQFDFRQIRTVSSHDHWLELHLKTSNPNLLSQLLHPETAMAKLISTEGRQDFSITAGPYTLVNYGSKEAVLKRNPFYPKLADTEPDEIYLSSSNSIEDQIRRIETDRADFIIPLSGMTPQMYRDLKSTHRFVEIDPRTGYTFWIAPIVNSPVFKEKSQRLALAKMIANANINFEDFQPYWSRASQLYLNDGFGRPSPAELAKVNFEISGSSRPRFRRIKILASSTFPFKNQIANSMRHEGIEVDYIFYSNFNEFEGLLKQGDFDAFQINNDFSSSDILENLQVTLSESRPLISVGAGDLISLRNLLKKANETQIPDEKYAAIKEIGLSLLRNGYVIPIAYRKNISFANKRWDYSCWSNLFPDFRFWKISLRAQGGP